MLTNWSTLQKRIERLKFLENLNQHEEFENYSKKEISSLKKEYDKLKKLFGGIKNMTTLPDVVIFTNQFKESLAIEECRRLGIPTICIVDTNCDPDLVPYPRASGWLLAQISPQLSTFSGWSSQISRSVASTCPCRSCTAAATR